MREFVSVYAKDCEISGIDLGDTTALAIRRADTWPTPYMVLAHHIAHHTVVGGMIHCGGWRDDMLWCRLGRLERPRACVRPYTNQNTAPNLHRRNRERAPASGGLSTVRQDNSQPNRETAQESDRAVTAQSNPSNRSQDPN